MKVGILTWYFGANYGAKAQAYALQQTILKLGYEVCMINYKPEVYKKVNIGTNLNVEHAKRHPLLYYKCIRRVKKLWHFNKKYNETCCVKAGTDIDDLNLDYIVFGSDAIFNVEHVLFRDIYMGVGIEKTKKISYAPSCEDLNPNYRLNEQCVESLKQFKSISVRDEHTQELILKNVNRKAIRVLDPTLLYDFRNITTEWDEENYILIYTFSAWNQYRQQLKEFAKSKGLRIVAVGRYCDWADKCYVSASFEEWICSFRKASYVFTDSFHGTVFSIKNSKEIILCSRIDKRDKIQSLLNDAGIHRGFYSGKNLIEDYLIDEPIDYSMVNKNINKYVTESIDFLKKSLN